MNFKFKDEECKKGNHFYFLKVKLIGDPSLHLPKGTKELGHHSRNNRYLHNLVRAVGVYAWTSSIWISVA